MKKMKKVLWLLLAAMIFGLTACSGGKPQGMRPETAKVEDRKERQESGEEEEEQDEKQEGQGEEQNLAQKQDGEQTAEEYERGTVNGNYYESKWLGIKLNLSDDYVMATQEEFEQARETGADLIMTEEAQEKYDAAAAAVVPEMAAVCLDGSAARMNISIAVEKLPLSNMTVEQYVTLARSGMENSVAGGTEMVFGDTSEVEIAGETYVKQPLTTSVQGMSANIDMYMRIKDGRIALITLTYLPEQAAQADELIASIERYE